MLHPRQFAFGRLWIRTEEVFRNDQTKNRITEKLKRFVMQIPRIALGRHLFVSPRTMRHRLSEEIAISELIVKDLFELIQAR